MFARTRLPSLLQRAILVAFCLLMALPPPLVGARELFQPTGQVLGVDEFLELQSDPFLVGSHRYQLAHIDQNEVFRSINYKMPLIFNLFNDVEFRAHVQKVKELSGGSSFISGSLVDGGHFTLFLHKSGIVRGEIHSLRGTYTLKSEGDDFNQVLIKQEDLSGVTLCGNDDAHTVHKEEQTRLNFRESGEPLSVQDWVPDQVSNEVHVGSDVHTRVTAKAGTSSDNNTIDVLVVYTQRAEDYEGGPEQMQAAIENEIAKMNQALENSGLAHRQVKLAHMEKVDYTQATSSLGADLSNLAYTSEDGGNRDYSTLDEVHLMIEEYQADLVHLFVRDALGACGTAATYILHHDNIEKGHCENSDNYDLCMFNRRRNAWKGHRRVFRFSASSMKCSSRYVFAHELGHSLALRHQRSDYEWEDGDIENGFFPFRPYAFGYSNLEYSKICQLTAMDNGNACRELGMYNYRIPYFSNPDLFFPPPTGQYAYYPFTENTPMGVPGDEYTIDLDGPVNAAKAIDDVWDIVASLSEPGDVMPPGFCNTQDISSNALTSSLNSQVNLSSEEESRDIIISFPVPDNCTKVSLNASSSASFINASVQKIREGEYELSIAASANNSSCNSRSAQVTVKIRGVSGVSPASISVTQASNEFCRSISGMPEDSVSLDFSGQNPSPSFRLIQGMFSRFTQLERLNLSRNQLSDLRPGVFNGVDQLTTLNLSHNQISSFDSTVFDSLDLLKNLDLSNNQLTEVPDSVFANLHRLEDLNLSHNQFNRLQYGVFNSLRRLKTLDLSYNQLRKLPLSAFAFVFYLSILKINNNQIDELEENTFFGTYRLKQLNLGNNEITNIHERAFRDNSQLTHLWLHNNEISSLPESVFSNLTDLRMLNLSRNEIEEIPDLSNSTEIETLQLYDNKISDLSSDSFSLLSDLRLLSLNKNALTTLPANVFQDNSNLEHLHLSSNEISRLPSHVFSNLSNLRSLSLSKNQLTEMPNLSGLSNLVNLWLYSNQIGTLSRNDLSGLSNLKSLDLSKNQINRIEGGVFSGLSQVTQLRLYDNNITSLFSTTFNGLSNVVFLALSRNNITRLSDNVFSKMPNLKQLWIHSNQIRSISPHAFSGLSQLEYLNISYNPIQGPLPAQVCAFIRSVPTAHMNGIDMDTVCPR